MNSKNEIKIEKVNYLVAESERMYLGREKALIPGHDYIRRHVSYPITMVLKGMDFVMKEFMTSFIVYFVMMFGLVFVLKNSASADATVITNFLFPFIISLPLFVVLFFPPTIYCHSRVKVKLVQNLIKELKENEYDSNGFLKLLDIFKLRAQKRVLFLKRLYALLWAGFVYILKDSNNLGIELLSKSNSEIMSLIGYFSILVLGLLAIEAYSKSTDIIFTSVEIALIEVEG